MRIALIMVLCMGVNVIGARVFAASGEFEVAKLCSDISRGFAQLRIVIKQLDEHSDSSEFTVEIVENGYKKVKRDLISLDWIYRATAGQKGWETLYKDEDDGGGMVNIAISFVDDLFEEVKRSGRVESAKVSTIDHLLFARSKQLISACRADYGGT